jgi:hypothetical protein
MLMMRLLRRRAWTLEWKGVNPLHQGLRCLLRAYGRSLYLQQQEKLPAHWDEARIDQHASEQSTIASRFTHSDCRQLDNLTGAMELLGMPSAFPHPAGAIRMFYTYNLQLDRCRVSS